jgi:hypothetical protein
MVLRLKICKGYIVPKSTLFPEMFMLNLRYVRHFSGLKLYSEPLNLVTEEDIIIWVQTVNFIEFTYTWSGKLPSFWSST